VPLGTKIDLNAYNMVRLLNKAGKLSVGVITHHNATPHNSRRTQELLQQFHWELLNQPPLNPESAMLTTIRLDCWRNICEVPDFGIMGSKELLYVNGCEYKDFNRDWIYESVPKWRKCMNVFGDQLAVNGYASQANYVKSCDKLLFNVYDLGNQN
jgi:hypothetical protein